MGKNENGKNKEIVLTERTMTDQMKRGKEGRSEQEDKEGETGKKKANWREGAKEGLRDRGEKKESIEGRREKTGRREGEK